MMIKAGDDEAFERMSEFLGPTQIDQVVRQAIHMCWMALPKERRTYVELEAQIRRLVERALKDVREDMEAFGRPST